MAKEIQFILYNMPDNSGVVQAIIQDETIFLSQKAMAEVFGVEVNTINYHLKEIYASRELTEDSTIRKIRTVQTEGTRQVERERAFYNLDAIISVGYRVNSQRATRFRQWATKILNEFIRKGFVLDDDRLKEGQKVFREDYFRELLERVRSIRASERRIWQQITDIYAECCQDYDVASPVTKEFYAMVQNKFHFAITGKTAAEIIHSSADHTKPYMGLVTWKNSPDGRVLKSDVIVAKNYLSEKQIKMLERTVTSYFDYIESQIERGNVFNMKQFAASANKFLTFNDYEILPDKGKISRKQAEAKAISEYDLFNPTQQIDSDFDKMIRGMLDK